MRFDYERQITTFDQNSWLDVFGGGLCIDVHREGELKDSLVKTAKADCLVFIEIHTDRMDCPESLRSAGRSMAKINKLE